MKSITLQGSGPHITVKSGSSKPTSMFIVTKSKVTKVSFDKKTDIKFAA